MTDDRTRAGFRSAARHNGRRDSGQAALITVVVAATTAMAAITAITELGSSGVDQARAQSAADAAALAGVAGGIGQAASLAHANGASLVTFTHVGDDVLVVVRLGDQSASARASFGSGAATP